MCGAQSLLRSLQVLKWQMLVLVDNQGGLTDNFNISRVRSHQLGILHELASVKCSITIVATKALRPSNGWEDDDLSVVVVSFNIPAIVLTSDTDTSLPNFL